MRYRTVVAGLVSIAFLFVVGCASETTAPPQATNATVYEGARLIVGDGSEPIEDAAFVVENDRFTAVGRRGEVMVPEGAARVDLTGKTVMPAIVDSHKHLPADNRDMLVSQLHHLAYWGVGAVTSLGQDTGDLAFQVRDEIIPNAARLTTAGRGITRPEMGRTEAPYWINTEEEGRNAVRELAARRVNLVKIWVDDRMGMFQKLTPALYGAIIDEAHKNNLRVTAHIFTLEDGKGLLRAGLDAFAHGVRDKDIDDEFLNLVKERPNVVLAPNLPDRGVAVDMTWIAETVPAEDVKRIQDGATDRPPAQQTFGIQARNLAKMAGAGVKIGMGTDGNAAWAHHVEMADMVAAGLTPAQVIVAATRNNAELLQLSDVGSVEANKSADFIVLDANPLEDITNTRRINAVYLRGAQVDRAALKAQLTSQVTQ